MNKYPYYKPKSDYELCNTLRSLYWHTPYTVSHICELIHLDPKLLGGTQVVSIACAELESFGEIKSFIFNHTKFYYFPL